MSRRRSFQKFRKHSPSQLQRIILRALRSGKRLNAKQIIKKQKLGNTKDSVETALQKMESDQIIRHVKDGKYKLIFPKQSTPTSTRELLYVGKVDLIRSGAAYITGTDSAHDIYVPAKRLKGAMHGDTVEIAVKPNARKTKQEGKVIKVIKRATERILGILRLERNFAVVYSTNPKNPIQVLAKLTDIKDAKDGSHVIAHITDWGKGQNKSIWGFVDTVLTSSSPSDIAMQGILIGQGFNLKFPPEVLEETKDIHLTIDANEESARRDFREVTTFTIDPDTAKDFDDALSLEYIDGNIEIGIHIADVAHYVKAGSALDKEALSRSTSVYLVDRVLPMLPEKLSNNLCSLVPNEDRLVFSAVFRFDKDLSIIDTWFGRGIIHSDRRFTYMEAQEIIESKKGDFAEELSQLNRIAIHYRNQRFKDGSINFESPELKFELDETGKPLRLYKKERKEAHLLVEDFMLLANKAVATYMAKKNKGKPIPFVYRVHDLPNPEKLEEFAAFAAELGYNMNLSTPDHISKSFNELSRQAQTNAVLRLLEPLAIRTMSKAEYTIENIGHYGLGFDFYTHFTSPIRRYSDVLVHRILAENLKVEKRMSETDLEDKCAHISLQERKAMEAERQSVKYKQVEFLKDRVGEVFQGFISGMIDAGIFVQLKEIGAEGLISFDTFDEPFAMEESRLKAKGKTSGQVLKLGDPVRVLLVSTDIEKVQIELVLIDEEESDQSLDSILLV